MKIGIIGLGYVGSQLMAELSKHFSVIGFDIVKKSNGTTNIEDLRKCNCFIVTVPTGVHKDNTSDLSALISATKSIAGILKKDDLVIYESTVPIGTTEDVCVPILEESGLKFNSDFTVGYSPERVNKGDTEHTLTTIQKIVSGSNAEATNAIADLYKTIVNVYCAPTIRVAEAAKILENSQRDVNIALMNAADIKFRSLGVDTDQVLKAASTKWNFLPFSPGLVGGDCLKAASHYLDLDISLLARKINNDRPLYIADEFMRSATGKAVLIMGVAYKKNCSDVNGSLVFDITDRLKANGYSVDLYDPLIAQYSELPTGLYDGILISVEHDIFQKDRGTKWKQ